MGNEESPVQRMCLLLVVVYLDAALPGVGQVGMPAYQDRGLPSGRLREQRQGGPAFDLSLERESGTPISIRSAWALRTVFVCHMARDGRA